MDDTMRIRVNSASDAIEKREDDTMRIRVDSASDATAAEIKYHLQCWVR